jgi:hypothetical protein
MMAVAIEVKPYLQVSQFQPLAKSDEELGKEVFRF